MVCKEVVKGLQGFSKGLRRVSEALRFGRLNVIVMCVGVLVCWCWLTLCQPGPFII